jgi:HTH-type transcriptional regulator/antitoxin HigA
MGMTEMYAEAFPPGDFLKEEMEARNWTQEDLASVMGKSLRLVNDIVNGKRAITPQTAKALGSAFGTSAQYWMNLESAWQLHQLSHTDEEVPRRARLYGKFPVKDMVKRGWVEDSDSIDVLESRFCEFFQLHSIEQTPRLSAAFRRSDEEEDGPNPKQLAWLYRAYQLASKQVPAGKFSKKSLDACFSELRGLLTEPEAARHVARLLSEAGVRFVIVEPFSGSKVDGVCFWLDSSSPVIALSLRLGRIDNFWFTLLHELRHVANGDGKELPIVDEDIVETPATSKIEQRANEEAAEFLVPLDKLSGFLIRVAPVYSFQNVVGFSVTNNVHPGIVVGQLQKRRLVHWSHFRKFLVDVRKQVTQSAMTDGWGFAPI